VGTFGLLWDGLHAHSAHNCLQDSVNELFANDCKHLGDNRHTQQPALLHPIGKQPQDWAEDLSAGRHSLRLIRKRTSLNSLLKLQ
jgi:hypothetical protein